MTNDEIVKRLYSEIANLSGRDVSGIGAEENILKLGLSSIQALKVINRLRTELQVDISPVALFEYNTIQSFAGYLEELTLEKTNDRN